MANKVHKFLCIGGPKNGKYIEEFEGKGVYLRYNRSASEWHANYNDNIKLGSTEKCVMVWLGLFRGESK